MLPKIRTSTGVRHILNSHPTPLEMVHRFVFNHSHEAMRRTLPTPDGTIHILLSFHPLLTAKGPISVAVVQSADTDRFALYTDMEFKDILKESIGLRAVEC